MIIYKPFQFESASNAEYFPTVFQMNCEMDPTQPQLYNFSTEKVSLNVPWDYPQFPWDYPQFVPNPHYWECISVQNELWSKFPNKKKMNFVPSFPFVLVQN